MARRSKSTKALPQTETVSQEETVSQVETAAPVKTEELEAVPSTNEVISAEGQVEHNLSDAFTEVLAQLGSWRSQVTALTAQVRALRSRCEREVRSAQKTNRRRKTNRKPSGFVKPTLISTELASFLGKPKGTEMARTEVTREINQYIRANKLQDPENGRIIRADNKLRSLLKLKKTDELTYFNLQKYMSPHFAKASDVEASAAVSAT
jgi:chromatin remodeling complex protein RSC6